MGTGVAPVAAEVVTLVGGTRTAHRERVTGDLDGHLAGEALAAGTATEPSAAACSSAGRRPIRACVAAASISISSAARTCAARRPKRWITWVGSGGVRPSRPRGLEERTRPRLHELARVAQRAAGDAHLDRGVDDLGAGAELLGDSEPLRDRGSRGRVDVDGGEGRTSADGGALSHRVPVLVELDALRVAPDQRQDHRTAVIGGTVIAISPEASSRVSSATGSDPVWSRSITLSAIDSANASAAATACSWVVSRRAVVEPVVIAATVRASGRSARRGS
jgi:hypothetical protein